VVSTRPAVEALKVSVCTVPTDAPEADGTLAWESTTIVIVEASAGGERGLGYTYGSAAIGGYVEGKLRDAVVGSDALEVPAAWLAMQRAARNDGRVGMAAMAISAVDIALHDLRARLLGVPLCSALGAFRGAVPVYGSGGFTSYSDERLAEQLAGWAEQGIGRVKMKVGRDQDADRGRVRAARQAIGPDVELYVDGNGAYSRQQALRWAGIFREEFGVGYFEEPVSSDDLEGLRLLRDRSPAGLAIAAGEYGYDLPYFARMVQAVDIQQADVSRCGGITGFLRVGALCEAHQVPFSAHCVPAVSAHACCAVQPLAHLEYFHDHVRIESLLFEGTLSPEGGALRPDLSRPGLGLELIPDAVEAHRA
jgi:L-alanine-DL-glutamate epimerase-like enolase superfamily enzyme